MRVLVLNSRYNAIHAMNKLNVHAELISSSGILLLLFETFKTCLPQVFMLCDLNNCTFRNFSVDVLFC